MDQVRLGRTDLNISVAGLGCGGYSRLGMKQGKDEAPAEKVIKRALDLGINCFDTARAYGTESVLGRMIAGRRDSVILSTKTIYRDRDGGYLPAAKLVESLEKSLERLGTDHVDIFSLHGVTAEHLDACVNDLVPALQNEVARGKIRYLGVTESFMHDPTHEMLVRAIPMGCFDMAMVGFNFLNPGARDNVFRLAQEHEVGTLIMHAVRRALSNPEVLKETVGQLIERSEVDASLVDPENPLGFLANYPDVASVVQAAYRFCRHEPGVSCVLTGTGSQEHLASNVDAIMAAPLPVALQDQLTRVFGDVRSISGD